VERGREPRGSAMPPIGPLQRADAGSLSRPKASDARGTQGSDGSPAAELARALLASAALLRAGRG